MELASEYYHRRFEDEILAAARAASAVAEERHRQLAFLYACELQALGVPLPEAATAIPLPRTDRAA